ncbi:metal ABC transporter substrate-binding protein [Bacillaceae bacterium W0354]
MKVTKFIFFTLSLVTLFACQSQSNQDNENSYKIITSIYPIEYITSELTDNLVEVETIIPPGADAHSYEPSTKKMIQYASTDAFFFVGEGMETFAETMSQSLKSENVATLKLSDYEQLFITDEHSEEHDEHDHGDVDPHFWLDPERMVLAAEIIRDELIELYPDHENELKENFNDFKGKMIELDETFQSALSEGDAVEILVSHSAFSYWESKYPFKQYSIRGLSASQEPSQKQLQEIFDLIKTNDFKYIFQEKNRDDRLVTTIADELSLTMVYLHNLSTRTDEEVEQGLTYVDLMLNNLDTLLETR